MEHTNELKAENLGIRDLLDRYLVSRRSSKSSAAETSAHLDDDSLATFVEGAMSQRESASVIGHLVDCGFCLHKTAELIRLDLEFSAASDSTLTIEPAQPAKISAVISELFSRIFGTSEGAVFAHEEKDESEKKADEESDDKNES